MFLLFEDGLFFLSFFFLTHIYILFKKIFFSIMVSPRRLDIVPCAIQ